ncbi:hypothetical protein PPACK8108_LOCUS12517 [Phakopsora pachyrhizi]|uniref:Uncharacterized protein n=1 Tax=Phakopsora pachyrhizi TaxID=170000 RepID=A0AAV0B1U3_PHAPC|nr:hypothetical protein PPACK8108_LOCUS12517 [Phakopsora pachyrhizi]
MTLKSKIGAKESIGAEFTEILIPIVDFRAHPSILTLTINLWSSFLMQDYHLCPNSRPGHFFLPPCSSDLVPSRLAGPSSSPLALHLSQNQLPSGSSSNALPCTLLSSERTKPQANIAKTSSRPVLIFPTCPSIALPPLGSESLGLGYFSGSDNQEWIHSEFLLVLWNLNRSEIGLMLSHIAVLGRGRHRVPILILDGAVPCRSKSLVVCWTLSTGGSHNSCTPGCRLQDWIQLG